MRPFNNDRIERIGVSYCENVLSQQGMIFREQPIRDYGVDAQIETIDAQKSYASGKIVAVQIKTGSSYFSEASEDYVVYRGERKHYDYWLRHALPVIIILYNPETDECIWEHITSQTASKTEKGWLIKVPKNQRLKSCKNLIEEIAKNQSEYEKKLHTLLLAKPWMKAIINGNQVILESDEWVNKTSGRGSVILKIIDKSDVELIAINWPFVCFGLTDYNEVFRRLFPWADFEVDHDIYDDIEEDEFIIENCPYDSEEGEYLFTDSDEFLEDLENYRNELSEIRPYDIASGEVASYRLILSLNRIGKMFLELDQFLENEEIYCFDENQIE